jgi:hypothetical protein
VQSVGAKAGAYLGSWGSWAAEKKKGWGRGNASQQVPKREIVVEKEVIRPRTQDSFEEAIFDAELAAKHTVDGVITKIEIPMSPPAGEEENRRSRQFPASKPTTASEPDFEYARPTLPARPVIDVDHNSEDKLNGGASKLQIHDAEPNVWASSSTEDAATVAKRKGDISDATGTPISP